MNPGATAVVVLRRPVPPIARRSAERAIRAHCADSCARDRRDDRFRENRTAIALADHPLPVSATTAEQAARDDAAFNELIARLDEEDDDSDG